MSQQVFKDFMPKQQFAAMFNVGMSKFVPTLTNNGKVVLCLFGKHVANIHHSLVVDGDENATATKIATCNVNFGIPIEDVDAEGRPNLPCLCIDGSTWRGATVAAFQDWNHKRLEIMQQEVIDPAAHLFYISNTVNFLLIFYN